jgi:hypothetical protein
MPRHWTYGRSADSATDEAADVGNVQVRITRRLLAGRPTASRFSTGPARSATNSFYTPTTPQTPTQQERRLRAIRTVIRLTHTNCWRLHLASSQPVPAHDSNRRHNLMITFSRERCAFVRRSAPSTYGVDKVRRCMMVRWTRKHRVPPLSRQGGEPCVRMDGCGPSSWRRRTRIRVCGSCFRGREWASCILVAAQVSDGRGTFRTSCRPPKARTGLLDRCVPRA